MCIDHERDCIGGILSVVRLVVLVIMLSDEERRDRRMALDALEKDAAKAWTQIAPKYQTDKEFILAALHKSPTLPPKGDFERKFPQALRFDRDVVLAFASRDDFEELYYDRHLFVPDCLTGDKQVMLAYCSKIPRSLQECTEDLCDDREVVEAAIALDGLELQYASIRLQEEKDIVVAACQKDGRALEFCPPGPVRGDLTSDRNFMLSVLRKHGGPMLRLVSEPLRRDRELLLEALKHGMRFRFCPFEFQTDKAFLLEALERKSELYLEMNRNIQSEPDIALAAVKAEDSTPAVHSRALENVPNLTEDRSVVLAIAKRGDKTFLKELLTEGGHDIHRDDKTIMLTAIERDCKLFAYASARLRDDPDILLAAIQETSAADVLRAVSADTQREHPEITIKAIRVGSGRCLRLLRGYIPEEMWRIRDVVIAWIRRGCRILEQSERLLQEDREMALEVAEHVWHEFAKVGDALKGDMEFMTQAVDKNGRVLRFAAPAIRDNLQLAVRAVASHPDSLVPSIRVDKTELKNYVKSKLDLHETFLNDFLRGIAVATPHIPPARRSQLPMLDRGVETSQAFKQLIAKFLGVPTGADLRIMRTAWHNLTLPRDRPNENETEAEAQARLFAVDNADRWARRRLVRRRGWQQQREENQDEGDGAAAGGDPMDPPGLRVFLHFGARRRDRQDRHADIFAPNNPVAGEARADQLDVELFEAEDEFLAMMMDHGELDAPLV